MTFKRGVLRRGRIYSDEGFSFGIVDKTHLTYREGRGEMTITGELLIDGFVIDLATVGPWDDGTPISAAKKELIIERIRRGLEWQGKRLELA